MTSPVTVQDVGADDPRPADSGALAETFGLGDRPGRAGEPPSPQQLTALCDLCHDVRQPAAAICALAAAIEVVPGLPSAVVPRLAQIVEEARRISSLCREMLATRSAPAAIRVDTVTEQAAGTMRQTFTGRIDVSAAPAVAMIDELLLWRVLINIVENACRAAAPDGRVAIRVRQRGTGVSVQISDSGPGFGLAPPGAASLGLMIAERALRGSGGLLTVDRGPLGGARVTLTLPRAEMTPTLPSATG